MLLVDKSKHRIYTTSECNLFIITTCTCLIRISQPVEIILLSNIPDSRHTRPNILPALIAHHLNSSLQRLHFVCG